MEIEQMANVNEIYASKWLKAEDLQNRTITVTISGAHVEDVTQASGEKEKRIVVGFVGKNKRLICNKTQALALAKIGGDDSERWTNIQVMLAPSMSSNSKPTIAILPMPSAVDQETPFQ